MASARMLVDNGAFEKGGDDAYSVFFAMKTKAPAKKTQGVVRVITKPPAKTFASLSGGLHNPFTPVRKKLHAVQLVPGKSVRQFDLRLFSKLTA